MKKLICFTIIILTEFTFGQIAIGKDNVTNNSVLLEFGTEPKGIILPSVASVLSPSNGTFVYNTTTNSIQVLVASSWKNLTELGPGIPHTFTNCGLDVGNGVIMGSESSNKNGALILESTTKALVLPHVQNPHLNMKGVIAGTVVYDSVSDTFAVFDGKNWNYWN